MKPLLKIVLLLLRGERRAFLRGLALSITVLIMGVSLLGLSGWFITAAAAAGLAGIGVLFNVFAPSAMVRFLALGRTAARYGERLLTHDATLRVLSRLRIRMLQGYLVSPYRQLERLRANSFLNRVTADIDALDGVLLRLVLPGLAGVMVIFVTAIALWFLVDPSVALLVGLGYLVGPTLIFLIGQHIARPPSRQAEAAMQASRSRLIDLIAGREDLAVYGQLQATRDHVQSAQARHGAARQQLDRIERRTGVGLDLIGAGVTALALGQGIALVQAGTITAAQSAIGVFAALALAEAVAPVRRALSEIGRMIQAARHVLPSLSGTAPEAGAEQTAAARVSTLLLFDLTYRPGQGDRALFEPVTLSVGPGETVALTGPSGIGKSTVLLLAAGALNPSTGGVNWGGRDLRDYAQEALQQSIAMVPQRHALIAGTVAENLRLAAPEASDDDLWQALETTCLAATIRAKGGLEAKLGFRGAGLSGGEARRLVLARAVLRRPGLLLLDEPTEGLDDATAKQVMAGIRAALPEAAILMAAHRPVEIEGAGRSIALHGTNA